jgi:hypothetical protein
MELIISARISGLILELREQIKCLEREIIIPLKPYHLTISQFFTLWATLLWNEHHNNTAVNATTLSKICFQDERVTATNLEHCVSYNYLKYENDKKTRRTILLTELGRKITPPLIQRIKEIESKFLLSP